MRNICWLWFGVLPVSVASAFAQHAVRDDFSNGKGRGVTFAHFTKERRYHPDYQPMDLNKVKFNGNLTNLKKSIRTPKQCYV